MRELDDITGAIVELKSVERLAAVHGKQLLTYLTLANMPIGLLSNFGRRRSWSVASRGERERLLRHTMG